MGLEYPSNEDGTPMETKRQLSLPVESAYCYSWGNI